MSEENESVDPELSAAVAAVGSNRVMSEIQKNCAIMYVTVRCWRGQYQMHGASVLFGGRTVDDDMVTSPSAKLLSKDWHSRLHKFEGQVRKAVRQIAVPFRDGVYIVPLRRVPELTETVESIRGAYLRTVEEFLKAWPDEYQRLENSITARHGFEAWLAVAKCVPSNERVKSLFGIELGMWPIKAGGLPVSCFEPVRAAAARLPEIRALVADLHEPQRRAIEALVDDVQAAWSEVEAGAKKFLNDGAAEHADSVQRATDQLVASAVSAMLTVPIRELNEQIDNLLERAQERTARQQSLDAVQRAFTKLRGFEFMLPQELVTRLAQAELQLGAADPQVVNSGARAGEALGSYLRQLRTDLSAETGSNALTRMTRALDI